MSFLTIICISWFLSSIDDAIANIEYMANRNCCGENDEFQ